MQDWIVAHEPWLRLAVFGGLLQQFDAPPVVEGALAFLALDGLIYRQHRLFHRIPLFWRLHRMHHSDVEFDATRCGSIARCGAWS